MHYAIFDDGKKVPVGSKPEYVKLQCNGCLVLCDEREANGVIVDGESCHLRGREAFTAPTVTLVYEEVTAGVLEQLTTAQLAICEICEICERLKQELDL